MNDKELSETLYIYYIYLNRFTNRDREFSEILEKYPEVKAAERSMREAINNSVFHDVFDIRLTVRVTQMDVVVYVKNPKRRNNRIKAYPCLYEKLKPALMMKTIVINEVIAIWEGILKEGVPAVRVAYMVKRHIAALEALPDETEGKTQALIACREFAMRPEIFENITKI